MNQLVKDMANIIVAFKVLEQSQPTPIILVLDIKMDFTWKARWVKDGHITVNSLGYPTRTIVERVYNESLCQF